MIEFQINAVTDYLDLSNVYGLSEKMSEDLRTKEGGKLKTEVRHGHVYAPKEYNMEVHCKCNLANENTCYKTGMLFGNNPLISLIIPIIIIRLQEILDPIKTPNLQSSKYYS